MTTLQAAPKSAAIAIPADLLERLACLHCRAALAPCNSPNELSCTGCGARFPCEAGIPSLIRGGPESQNWNNWDRDEIKRTGHSYYRRAAGALPEKEASKSYARLIQRRGLHEPGDHLLDLGCATGHFYRSFRDRLDPPTHYTGLDSNPQFLRWGADIFGISDRCNFVHGDVLEMPFRDRSFDLVVVNLFHFFPNIADALSEAMRVARRMVLWRTPIGQTNYVVKVVQQNDFAATGVLTPERDDVPHCLYMLYSETYLRGLVPHLGGRIAFIERDTDFEPFDNTAFEEFQGITATRTVGDMQVNGNLILDWQYVGIVPNASSEGRA